MKDRGLLDNCYSDPGDVALAATQGLNEKLEEKQVEIDRLYAKCASPEQRLVAMVALMKSPKRIQ